MGLIKSEEDLPDVLNFGLDFLAVVQGTFRGGFDELLLRDHRSVHPRDQLEGGHFFSLTLRDGASEGSGRLRAMDHSHVLIAGPDIVKHLLDVQDGLF